MRTTHIEISFVWSKPRDWVENLHELMREILEEFMVRIAADDYHYFISWMGIEMPRIGIEKIEYTKEEYREVELEKIERA